MKSTTILYGIIIILTLALFFTVSHILKLTDEKQKVSNENLNLSKEYNRFKNDANGNISSQLIYINVLEKNNQQIQSAHDELANQTEDLRGQIENFEISYNEQDTYFNVIKTVYAKKVERILAPGESCQRKMDAGYNKSVACKKGYECVLESVYPECLEIIGVNEECRMWNHCKPGYSCQYSRTEDGVPGDMIQHLISTCQLNKDFEVFSKDCISRGGEMNLITCYLYLPNW